MRVAPRPCNLSRRRVLTGLALGSASLGLPSWAVTAERAMGVDDARHLLTRTGFGASPLQIAEFARYSRRDAVERLFGNTSSTPQTAPPAEVLEYLAPRRFRDAGDDEKKAMQRDLRQRGMLLRAWWLSEMVNAPTALNERMTLFWHNHFTSSLEKVKAPVLMARQNQLLRRHALGNFGEMLHAIGRDPAMLVYLDGAQSRKGQPNENFAREVMELFTLGEGHYTEQDVKEAARAFTGWSIEPETGEFRWRPFAHDDGIKTVLGQTGRLEGDSVLDCLLARAETAEFVVAKLWREFVAPTPAAGELTRIAGGFRDSGYRIAPTLRAVLLSEAFWVAENRAVLVKSPVDLVAGTLRTLGMTLADPAAALPYVVALAQMDQNLLAPPNVKGWPGGDVWINSKTVLARRQFIERLLRDDGRPEEAGGMAMPKKRVALKETFGKGANALDGDLREQLRHSLAGIHVDTQRWFDSLARAGLTAENVLLPTAAQNDGGTDDAHALRRWMLDPAYQLK
jgi:uncharacterized protein (DUF1800 family)